MARESIDLTIDLRTWQGRALKLCARLGLERLAQWFGEQLVERMMREQYPRHR